MSVKTKIHDGPTSHGSSGDYVENSRLGRRFALSSFCARCPNFQSTVTLTFIAQWARALILIGRSLVGGHLQTSRRTTGPIARQATGWERRNGKATNSSDCHKFEPRRIEGGTTMTATWKGLAPIRGWDSRSDGPVQDTVDTYMSSHGDWPSPMLEEVVQKDGTLSPKRALSERISLPWTPPMCHVLHRRWPRRRGGLDHRAGHLQV